MFSALLGKATPGKTRRIMKIICEAFLTDCPGRVLIWSCWEWVRTDTRPRSFQILRRCERRRIGLCHPGTSRQARIVLQSPRLLSITRGTSCFWLPDKKKRNASKRCYPVPPDQNNYLFRQLLPSTE